MRLNLVFIFFAFSVPSKAQNCDFENKLIEYILSYYIRFHENAPKTIIFNNEAIKTRSISYFKNSKYWQSKGVINQNCYSEKDSIKNITLLNKTYILRSDSSNVFFVNEKDWINENGFKVYIFKRFYLCDKIYVTAVAKNPFYSGNTEFLGVFNLDSKLISFYNQSYVF